jgi:single-strand DNA-binding protein
MAGINKVVLIGNVGKDPEIKEFQSGDKAVKFSIATSETWKDKATGEKKERVEWHNVTVFGKLADVVAQYVKKGSKVYVEGSNKTRRWVSQTGENHYTTEVHAKEVQFLDKRDKDGGHDPVPAEQDNNDVSWEEPPY